MYCYLLSFTHYFNVYFQLPFSFHHSSNYFYIIYNKEIYFACRARWKIIMADQIGQSERSCSDKPPKMLRLIKYHCGVPGIKRFQKMSIENLIPWRQIMARIKQNSTEANNSQRLTNIIMEAMSGQNISNESMEELSDKYENLLWPDNRTAVESRPAQNALSILRRFWSEPREKLILY